MFSCIVCATDGGEHGDRALARAIDLAREQQGDVHAVHVVERMLGGRLTGQTIRLDESEIDDKIRRQVSEAREHGVNARLHMVRGSVSEVADRIAAIADDVDANLIVTGTRGRSTLTGLVAGSVAHRLIHASRRPILIVPEFTSSAAEASDLAGVAA